MKRKYELRTYNTSDGTLQSTVEIYCNKEEHETIKNALKLINYSCYGNNQIPPSYIKIVLAKDEEILSLPDERGFMEASCQFCNKKYKFTKQELEELVKRRNSK